MRGEGICVSLLTRRIQPPILNTGLFLGLDPRAVRIGQHHIHGVTRADGRNQRLGVQQGDGPWRCNA